MPAGERDLIGRWWAKNKGEKESYKEKGRVKCNAVRRGIVARGVERNEELDVR